MPKSRRKISAVLKDFQKIILKHERYDAENQKNFSSIGKYIRLSKTQLFLLTESIYFASFRAFEGFLRDIFLLYCMGHKTLSGNRVISYLNPKDFSHAEKLIRSSMKFLDWASPDELIDRSEIYLKDGYPIKTPISTNLQPLREFRKIRNHIAHESSESYSEYIKVIRNYYTVVPLRVPSPGEFLLLSDRRVGNQYKLITFFNLVKKISINLTN